MPNKDDVCLFCVHPRSVHTGCDHHGACCKTVDCTCIGFSETVERAASAPRQRAPKVGSVHTTDVGDDLVRIEFVGVDGMFLNSIVIARKEARAIGQALVDLSDEPSPGDLS